LNNSQNSATIRRCPCRLGRRRQGDRRFIAAERRREQSFFCYRSVSAAGVIRSYYVGTTGDTLVCAEDFDGDGNWTTRLSASNNTWYIRQSSNNQRVLRSVATLSDERLEGDFDATATD
jgi:hypothetical protein